MYNKYVLYICIDIITSLQLFNLKPIEHDQLSVELSGFFTFSISSYFEMKENNKISPYKLIESNNVNSPNGHILVFALTLSDINQFLVRIISTRIYINMYIHS